MNELPRQVPETDEIQIPGAPPIAGLRFRRFRGEMDIPLISQAGQVIELAESTGHIPAQDVVAEWFSPTPHFDPYRNTIFAEAAGELVAFGRGYWYQQYSGEYIYWHRVQVRPDWRGRGIGTAMLRYLQAILEQVAQGHESEAEKFYETHVYESETSMQSLLEKAGYRPVRYFFRMVRPLDEPIPDLPLPNGVQVRSVPPDQYLRVADALVEAMRDHWAAHPPDDEDFHLFFHQPFFQPELWQVAFAGEEVAGMVLNHIHPEEHELSGVPRGWTDPIAVRRPWRRQGLASALLARSLHMLKEQGMQEAILGVDSDNPSGARGMYESMGFRTLVRWAVYRKAFRTEREPDESRPAAGSAE